MKKILFAFVLLLSIFSTAQAGYLIRSIITGIVEPADLQNYTLTFDRNGELYLSFNTNTGYNPFSLPVTSYSPSESTLHLIPSSDYETYSIKCEPFKGEDPAPELIKPFEDEGEITTYYDRITVKDTPTNTHYQIYTITGQLIQTGTTNPDIFTAELSKGIYILRLENGKAFKFVK